MTFILKHRVKRLNFFQHLLCADSFPAFRGKARNRNDYEQEEQYMEKSKSTEAILPMTSVKSGAGVEVAPDVYCYTNQIVNLFYIGNPEISSDYILVDAGMPRSGSKILQEAENRFGPDANLKAIILTHGHFDHIGG